MEREKQELRDYLEKDKKAMTDKMSAEEAERQRKEKEMAVGSNHSIFHSGVIEFVPLCNDQEQGCHERQDRQERSLVWILQNRRW